MLACPAMNDALKAKSTATTNHTHPASGPIMVGVSGGVDSAVSALLLKEQGYEVQAVFMQNWLADKDDPHCRAEQDLTDARQVCDQIGVPLQTVEFADVYWERVFQRCLDDLALGLTPNPDVLCNSEVKYRAFLDYARAAGMPVLATGHYAQRQQTAAGYQLRKGHDPQKDQSYFLARLTQAQLQHAHFPIGHLCKADVRAYAARQGLAVHAKKDSTGLCFVGERRFTPFIQEYLRPKPGPITDDAGQILGTHQGLMFHTIGQRKGLGLGGGSGPSGEAWYVAAKDMAENRLIVVQGAQHPLLYQNTVKGRDCYWFLPETAAQLNEGPLQCQAKIRYRQADQPCTLTLLPEGGCQANFHTPQRAVTPGQYMVFYCHDICLGSAVIVAQS